MYSLAATLGNESSAKTSEYGSPASTSGYSSPAATSGKCSHAVASGNCSYAATSGKDSIAAAIGHDAAAKASLGSWIVLAEYGDDGHYPLLCVKCGKIDGTTLQPDVWYKLKDGEFVEADGPE